MKPILFKNINNQYFIKIKLYYNNLYLNIYKQFCFFLIELAILVKILIGIGKFG